MGRDPPGMHPMDRPAAPILPSTAPSSKRTMFMDVDCPKCNHTATHDVPAREAGRTDYPVECPNCHAKFELWLDPGFFM